MPVRVRGGSARYCCARLRCGNEFRHVRSFHIRGPEFFRAGQAGAAAQITAAVMTVSIRIAAAISPA
jgi:hypothetical protein